MSKLYQSKEYLKEQYVDLGLTMKQIAERHNVNVVTIHNWLKNHGIERRDPNFRDAGYRNKSILEKQYLEQKLTLVEIAEIYGVSASVIRYWIVKFNIPARQAGHQPGKPLSENQRKSLEPVWESLKGREVSQETRKKLSLAMSGKNHPNYGKRNKHKGRYWVTCPDGSLACMRSNWEVSYSEWLTANNHIDWQYEPKTFVLSNGRAYTPDFWVSYLDAFVEVKGWLREDGKAKLGLFKKEYPEIKLVFADRKYLASIGCDLFAKHELNKPKTICAYCGCEFEKKYPKQITCSTMCRNQYIVTTRKPRRR
jgi:transposase-like protein